MKKFNAIVTLALVCTSTLTQAVNNHKTLPGSHAQETTTQLNAEKTNESFVYRYRGSLLLATGLAVGGIAGFAKGTIFGTTKTINSMGKAVGSAEKIIGNVGEMVDGLTATNIRSMATNISVLELAPLFGKTLTIYQTEQDNSVILVEIDKCGKIKHKALMKVHPQQNLEKILQSSNDGEEENNSRQRRHHHYHRSKKQEGKRKRAHVLSHSIHSNNDNEHAKKSEKEGELSPGEQEDQGQN